MTRWWPAPRMTRVDEVGGDRQQRAQAEHLDEDGVLLPEAVPGDVLHGRSGFSVTVPSWLPDSLMVRSCSKSEQFVAVYGLSRSDWHGRLRHRIGDGAGGDGGAGARSRSAAVLLHLPLRLRVICCRP